MAHERDYHIPITDTLSLGHEFHKVIQIIHNNGHTHTHHTELTKLPYEMYVDPDPISPERKHLL
jgi:hypothetical protein